VVRGLVPDLDAAAISALKKWRFKPATLDGKPIASKRRIVVEFRIEE
jgi:TonB family protein